MDEHSTRYDLLVSNDRRVKRSAHAKFRRLKGYKEISQLVSALADYGIKKGLARKEKNA